MLPLYFQVEQLQHFPKLLIYTIKPLQIVIPADALTQTPEAYTK